MRLIRYLIMLMMCCLLFLPQTGGVAKAYELPSDVQLQKDNYDSIAGLADTYPIEYITQVNNGEKRVKLITIASQTGMIQGEKVIELPPEIMRVAGFFRELNINGSQIKNLEVYWEGPTGKEKLSEYFRSETVIMGRPFHIKVQSGQYEGFKLRLKGTGTVTSLVLHEPNGLSATYDVRAWGVLGEDKPILPVQVHVDATTRRSIDGITRMEEEKFRRVYANPLGEPVTYEIAPYLSERGFLPGRQMFKFRDALEIGHKPGDPLLTEDPLRDGYADESFFDQHYEKDSQLIEQYDKLYAPDMKYVIAYDNWPTWNWPANTPNNPRGTPAVDKFEAAAELASLYTEAYNRKLDGRGPAYIEVKNESTIRSEWIYHNDAAYDSWGLLADFHNVTADKIKERSPEVLVGGPTSANMTLDTSAFASAREQMRFMDLTRGHLDFYSHHFYEGKDLILNETEANYGGYLTGRLEAVLDLLRNHMTLTNNIKPMVISETGTLHSGATDIDYWIQLKNFNAYMIRYMNRANEFDMVVPFLLPIKWWDKGSPDMLFRYEEDGSLGVPTPLKYYLDFWKDYQGDLLPVEANDDKVYVHATQTDNVIYVAVNNMNPQRLNLDLNLDLDGVKIYDIEQRRLYLEQGKLHYETKKQADLKSLPMAVEETSIIKITLDKSPVVQDILLEKTYYADEMLKATGQPAAFQIAAPVEQLQSSVLRVSFGRENGFNVPMDLTVNGKQYQHDVSYTNKPGRFFGYIDFDIPAVDIKEMNQVVVSLPQQGGTVSTVAFINHYALDGSVDSSPPETVANLEGAHENGWYRSGVSVQLEAFDPSGVAGIYYQLNDGEWTRYEREIEILTEGTHTLAYYSKDKAGNAEPVQSRTVAVDKTDPDVTIQPNRIDLGAPNKKLVDIKVKLHALDETSGIRDIQLTSITSSESDSGLYGGDRPDDIQGAEFGTHDLEFKLRAELSPKTKQRVYTVVYTATDHAGNQRKAEVKITVSKGK
ncbi:MULTISPECIES: OmpL47-type beta-barrel domain-containing protein [Paenibacillus]|uniref:OmpL47-type beta-barrel domain-containing protein n=1 Tax=Paenibacillus TaxID=44249 RepID=UPI00117F52A5|nr:MULTISPECIES: beta-agarase [Paenibacillus]